MKTYISLEQVRFYAFHGVFAQENLVGNDYEVTLRVQYDFSPALWEDNLAFTLNYAALYEAVREQMMIPSQLLEHLSGRILRRLIQLWPELESIELKVSKLNPPIVGQVPRASVEVLWQGESLD